MHILASKLSGLPLISLQTGDTVGWVHQPVILMDHLQIIAFQCDSPDQSARILLASDIRQLAADCLIIDNEDELSDPSDIVRLQDTLHTAYSPQDKSVVSDAGRRLGRVEDYNINLDTLHVQQLLVRQSLLQAWLGSNLIIDRSQIVDITPRRITVRDTLIKIPATQTGPVPEIQA